SLVIALSSFLVAVSIVAANPIQDWIVETNFGVRTNPLIASIVLFSPASILMGMVSPFAVRLRAGDIETVGATAGTLYGLSTFGSIIGTIAAAFWLVQSLGSESTVLLVAGVLA